MKKVKAFLSIWQNSLFPDETYNQRIIKAPFKFSYRYYLLLVLILHLLFSMLFVFPRLIKISQLKNSLNQTINRFPNRLKIYLYRGMVWSNLDRPYLAWTDFRQQKILLFVLDENASPDKITQYHSFALLTKNYFVLANLSDRNSFLSFPLTKTNSSFTIDKQSLAAAETTVNSLMIVLALCLSGIVFIGAGLLIFVTQTAWLIILATTTRLLLHRRRITFHKLLQIAFHSATLPLMITYILLLFNLPLIAIVRTNVLLTIIFLIGGVYESYLHQLDNRLRMNI